MRENLSGVAVRLGIFLTVCLLTAFLLVAVFGEVRFGEGKTYCAEFTNVSNLRQGKLVRIAGVEVGKVNKISINPDATVRVEFTADDSVTLTEGTQAVIRYDNLFGDRYLALEEGAGGLAILGPGQTIPLTRTRPALDLDALIGGFKPLFRALNPDQVNALSEQLLQAFQGQGPTIASFLEQAAALTNTLADRDQLIGQVVDNLNVVLSSIGRPKRSAGQSGDVAVAVGARARGTQRPISPTRWPTPTRLPARSPTCCRKPARRFRRWFTKPIGSRALRWPTTTTSTICSTRCRTNTRRWYARVCTATSSPSTCAMSS